MNLFELVAKLTLDSKEYDRALMAAKGSTVKAGGSMVDSINKTKKAIGVAAIAMAGAITAFGVKSVKVGMKFDTAISQVAATMGKTMKEMESETGEVDLAWGKFSGNLREYAKEMGAHTKFTAIESAEALNYMALAGYDTQKSMEMLPNVLNLAAAGAMDLAKASDMVTDASSALGLEQEETNALVDQMAMTASKANSSVEQLGRGILTVGGTAKIMKGGTVELNAALGILADNGIKGAQGGTALRNMLTTFTKSKFEKSFGALGVSAYDAQGKMRSLKDILADMNKVMDGMTDQEKTQLITKAFNARDLKSINALLGTTGERWDDLTDKIENSEGAAQKMADTQLDNLEGDITLLKSAFEGLQIEISDKLSPSLRKVVQFLTWCIDHAGTLGPVILGLASAFMTFAVAINFGNIVKKVTTAFKAFNAILAANPIGLLIAALVGLGVFLVTLYKNNEKFRDKVNAVWDAIKSRVLGVVNVITKVVKPAWEAIKNVVVSAVKAISDKVVPIWEAIKVTTLAIAEVIAQYVIPIWETMKAVIIEVVTAIRDYISEHFSEILGVVKAVFNGMLAIIKPILGLIRGIIKVEMSIIGGVMKLGFAVVFTVVSTVFKAIYKVVSTTFRAVAPIVSSVVSAIRSKIDSLKELVGRAKDSFNRVKNAIVSPIKSAYNTVKGWIAKIKSIFPLKVGKIFSNLKVPHIKISGGKAPFGIGGKGTKPSINVEWYKKAEQTPYLFSNATLFGAGEGKDEVLYGRQALMDDIREAVGGVGGADALYDALANIHIEVVSNIDGREVSRTIAPLLGPELNKIEMRANRKLGYV